MGEHDGAGAVQPMASQPRRGREAERCAVNILIQENPSYQLELMEIGIG
jgi:hypothetical protein